MSLRHDPTDPADMSPEDRMDEVASILARGILRLHGRVSVSAAPAAAPQNLPESSTTCLELSAPSRPDGVVG